MVLERIAYGGGATNWYFCRNITDLEAIERRLSAGSVVSLYFDDRIRRAGDSAAFRADVEQIIVASREAIVGALMPDGIRIDARIVAGRSELAEELADLGATSLFYGPFPARDNDGIRAVTLQIPDEDGVVRSYPH